MIYFRVSQRLRWKRKERKRELFTAMRDWAKVYLPKRAQRSRGGRNDHEEQSSTSVGTTPVSPSRKVISSWRVGGHAIASYMWKSRGWRSELKANRSSASGRVKDYLSESWCCRVFGSAEVFPSPKNPPIVAVIGGGFEIEGRPRVSPRVVLAHKEAVYQRLLLEAVTHVVHNVPTEPVHRHA